MAVFFQRAGRRGSTRTVFALVLALLVSLPPTVSLGERNFRTIVIDAGHGGFDRGGVPGQRVPEKTMALDVAQRLEKRLRQAGYRVVMTRDSDVFVPLGERVRIANRYDDALLVCVHFNSAQREGANGIETYYYGNSSASYAASIHRHLVGGTTTENRGIRRRAYYVLRRSSIPAVLVECGFLTNRAEARLVLESSYRQRLADRIADGVMQKQTPPNRPVVAGLIQVTSPIRQPFNYRDFVRPGTERQATRSSSKKSSRSRKKSSSSKKKPSSSSSKKTSSSSKKKSTTTKKSSTSETKKKKKTSDSEE